MIQLAGENTIHNESSVIDKKANATKKMAMWIASYVKNGSKPVFPPIAGGQEVNYLLQKYAEKLYGPEADNKLLAPLATVVEALANYVAAVQQGTPDDKLQQLGKDVADSWNTLLHDRHNFKHKYGLNEDELRPALTEAVNSIFAKD